MTDVLILKNIAGHRAGAIAKLDARLQKHVDAGNARILDDAPQVDAGWAPPAAAPEPAPWVHPDEDYDVDTQDA